MARLVVGAVGAVIGFYLGGPVGALQGFTIAYGLSAGLDPNRKVLGPKLDDLKAPQATYGAPISYIEGAPRLAGNYIWASDKRPVANTSSEGGKGGPGVDSTTFTYEIDALIELGVNRCQAIRRVFSNGKLVWSNADDADSETVAASTSVTAWRDMRFYDGAPDQLPDPTYEASVGVGNAPAYRSRTTVMIEGMNLGGSGQLPVLTFEVLSEADPSVQVEELARVPQDRSYIGGIPAASVTESFTMMVGVFDVTYDAGNGGIPVYNVYQVNPDGTFVQTEQWPVDMARAHTSCTGNSDRSCIVINTFDSSQYTCYFDDGSHAGPFDVLSATGVVGDAQDTRFAKVGAAFVFGGSLSGFGKKLAHFGSAGNLIAVSAALPTWVASVAISGANVYALPTGSATIIYKLDLATMALLGTISVPLPLSVPGFASVQGDADGGLVYRMLSSGTGGTAHDGSVWTWSGSAWTEIYTGLGYICAPPVDGSFSQGSTQLISQSWDSSTQEAVFRYAVTRVAIVLPRLDQVVRRLCLRTGLLTDDDIDVTDLSHDVAIADGYVRAMAVSQVGTTRTTLETLMSAYLFEAVEGETLRFVRRGGSSALTVPYEDMGASEDGKAEPLPLKRVNDIEIAARVSVKYANTTNDYQDGLERADRLVTESTAESVVEVPLGFEPLEAKKLADCNTLDLAVQLIQIGPVALSRKYTALEPTDVITLTGIDGSTFRARIVKATTGSGIYGLELVLDDATVINSSAQTDEDYTSSTLVRARAATDLALLDIPILRDADDGAGPYAAFSASGAWAGAELDVSPDDVTYAKVLDVSDLATKGTATSTLGDFTGGVVFDEINHVDVDVGDGTLSSSTRDALLTTQVNALLVGSEIIQFRDAALTGPGEYRLTGLLRGLRGTEWAMPDHVASERVVLLKLLSGIRHVSENVSDIGVPHYWKAVTFGQARASASSILFTDTGVALKPFSPANLRLLPNELGDYVATWDRRSRLSTSFLGPAGSVVPLGEASERYHWRALVASVEVADGYVTSPTYTFSRADQLAAGIAVGIDAEFAVSQVSATVGDGYEATAPFEGTGIAQPQISTVTVGGTFQSAKPLFVLINTTLVSYTTTAPDATLSGVATSLAAAIHSALPTYAATALGAVITVTGPPAASFTISAGMVGEEIYDAATMIAAAEASPGVGQKMVVGIYPFAGLVSSVAGATYILTLLRGVPGFSTRSVTYTYVATTAGWNGVQLMTAIVGTAPVTSDFLPSNIFWNFESGFGSSPTANSPVGEYWSASGVFVGDGNAYVGTSITRANVTPHPTDVAQVNRALFSAITIVPPPLTTPAGYIYRVTINGIAYDYTVAGGDDWFDVAAGIKAAINGSSVVVTADDSYYIVNEPYGQPPQVIVTAVAGNTPFTIDSRLIPGLINLTTALVQAAS